MVKLHYKIVNGMDSYDQRIGTHFSEEVTGYQPAQLNLMSRFNMRSAIVESKCDPLGASAPSGKAAANWWKSKYRQPDAKPCPI